MASMAEPSSPTDGPPGPPRTPGQNEPPLPPVPVDVGPGGQLDSGSRAQVERVLASDDFASFLKERSVLEEKHASGLKRLSRTTHDGIRRPESRQGSFAQNYEELTRAHDRMAEHGVQFSNTLFSMAEELYELAANSEKGRKHWKQTGLNAEKRVQDAEHAMEKAKSKYNSLAEQYDRARTGEKQTGKLVGFKQSAAQQEEDLQRKLEAADGDYAHKVQAAQTQQNELVTTLRPATVAALQDIIRETDAGLSAHMQKFAAQSEKLLLGYGLSITPMKGQAPSSPQSLREVTSSIDNERDFVEYVLQFSNKAGTRAESIRYEPHPSLSPKQAQPSSTPFISQPDPYGNFNPANHGRQMSGVTPYQGDEYEEYPSNQGPGPNYGGPRPGPPSQPNSYDRPPSQPATRISSGPPQLPQIESTGGDQFGGDTSGGDLAPLHSRASSGHLSGGPGPNGPNARPPGPQNQPSGPGQPGPANIGLRGGPSTTEPAPPNAQGIRPPRGASLGPSGEFAGTGQPGPGPGLQNGMPRPPNAGPPSQMGPPNGARPGAPGPQQSQMGPGNSGPQPVQMGRGQGPPGASSALRPAGSGPGPQQGMALQGAGRGGAGGGPMQGPPNGASRQGPGPGPGPQNGPPRPAQGPPNGAPRPSHPGPGGSISSLPSRQGGPRPGPPVRPVFGVSLDELFQRDGSAVPSIVYECVQAVDLYGLDVEGVYRTSGSAHHIMELRQQFDHDASAVDFRSPANFHNDIASVTTLLKHFLRDLPDPLLTGAQYQAFIDAAKLEEDIVRRDSIHALVNALPDPNYATLRTLVLHLTRVASHSDKNKMTQSNLAIVFAPTLMGRSGGMNGQSPGAGADIADAGWQAKVVETILNNTFQIFDDDE
ncbi:Rho GTPase-activating protein [Exophiala xenobiotica]|nr:Rho GTPase-activating protein [Exophiala xenobiotica]